MIKRPGELTGEIFDLLFSSADLSKFAPEEKIKYQNDVNTDRDIRNQIAYAKNQGIEQRNVEIAKAMLSEGLDASVISKCTGLSAEEIAALGE